MVRKKGTPWVDFYLRKKREKGTGKALWATARKVLTIIFILLSKQLDYWYIEERLYNKKLRVLQKAAGVRKLAAPSARLLAFYRG